MRRLITAAVILSVFLFGAQVRAQTAVFPMGGVGTLQFFDNNGVVLSSGALYFYLAGSSTAAATYTDSSGSVVNQNPLPLSTAGRATVWLTSQSYKIVLCSVSTDGANCAGAHILQSNDQVPGNFGASSGSATSPFTSSSANPATTGILRLASSDSGPCWRNAANSANICWSKDSSDRLSWAGGSLFFPEIGAPTGGAGSDLFWPDNTAHRWKVSNNGGTAAQLVISGADINTSDQVTSTHLSSALPVAQGGTGQASLTGLPLTNPVINTTSITGTPASGNLAAVIANGTVSMPTSTLAANGGCATASATATGATSSDSVEWNMSGTTFQTLLIYQAGVTTNQVTFQQCNYSSAMVTPGAETINWRVIR